jgi:ribosomal protein L37AE/L43A
MLPRPTERLRAAFRLLTKRGDDAVVCSFCGQGRDKLSHIIAGPGVAICWDCARIATDIAYDSVMDPATTGKTRFTVSPILEPGEKLKAPQRNALHDILTQQAAGHNCELLTWHYICGYQAIGDYLGFDVAHANNADVRALQRAVKASCRQAFELPTIGQNYA